MTDNQKPKCFGAAMVKARQWAGLSQDALAAEIQSTQSTISSWERGESEPPPDFVFEIERACRQTRGGLSRRLGYMPIIDDEPSNVEEAIERDPRLDVHERKLLVGIYIMMASD